MSLIGFDTATTITPQRAQNAIVKGVRLFFLYFKWLTAAQVTAVFQAAQAANVQAGIVPIFETTSERALSGPNAGTVDAQQVLAYCAKFGVPQGALVALTADFDEQASQDVIVCGYFAAAASVLHPASFRMLSYGNGALDLELKQKGITDETWVAGGSGMRGTAQYGSQADVQQGVGDKLGLNLGFSIDSDVAPEVDNASDMTTWLSTPASTPTPVKPPVQPPSVLTLTTLPPLKEVQTFLNVTADGIMGQVTGAAIIDWYDQNPDNA
jgi:hypothetical protein